MNKLTLFIASIKSVNKTNQLSQLYKQTSSTYVVYLINNFQSYKVSDKIIIMKKALKIYIQNG